MKFIDLNLTQNIQKAIEVCGYTKPTIVQAKAIPEILNRRNVIACAPTGTGKTAAFVLPILDRLSKQGKSKKPRTLILTPTRELANQITKAASIYGKFLRFNIVSLVGGMPYHHQIKDLARGADIIVATPGRLMDHMEQKRVDLSGIDMLVLDEADRMLDMGFIDDVTYITKLTPTERQTLLFSATVDKKLMKIVGPLIKNPVHIDVADKKEGTSPQIKQELYKTQNAEEKKKLLKHFLNDSNIYKAIIFSATKINADKLAMQLRDQGYAAASLHGDLKQNVRNRTIDQLRRGKIQFLVATDVAARGLDISDVTHVINYDLPRFCEDYVHRIGRTGRAGKTGTAISFVLPTERQNLQRIERYIGQQLNLQRHGEDQFDATDEQGGRERFKPENSFKANKSRRPVNESRNRHRDDKSYDYAKKSKQKPSRSRNEKQTYMSDESRNKDDKSYDYTKKPKHKPSRSRHEKQTYMSDESRKSSYRVTESQSPIIKVKRKATTAKKTFSQKGEKRFNDKFGDEPPRLREKTFVKKKKFAAKKKWDSKDRFSKPKDRAANA